MSHRQAPSRAPSPRRFPSAGGGFSLLTAGHDETLDAQWSMYENLVDTIIRLCGDTRLAQAWGRSVKGPFEPHWFFLTHASQDLLVARIHRCAQRLSSAHLSYHAGDFASLLLEGRIPPFEELVRGVQTLSSAHRRQGEDEEEGIVQEESWFPDTIVSDSAAI
ncbi:hypothetical protein JCM11491_002896 [Sporobolomyces phaffii]